VTMAEADELVFDTGPLSSFAEASWLGVLRSIAGDRRVVVPDAVEKELRQGAHSRPYLESVLSAAWIDVVVLDTDRENEEFAHFSSLMVKGRHNLGEAAVLAYAKVHGSLAVIDDRVGWKAARRAGVHVRGSLGLMIDAVNAGLLTLGMVSDLADHLIETNYRLPFEPGGFTAWVRRNDLVK
jgi:predicted nucleic acid-binding protein